MKKRLLIDLTVVIIIPLLVFLAVFLLGWQINYFTSLLLILGVPSLYLSFKNRYKVKKVALFSILVSIPIVIIFEILTFGDNMWWLTGTILPHRFLGIIALEDFLWMFLVTYIILIFYEHFINKDFQKDISKKIKVMNYILYPITIILSLIFVFNRAILVIPYAYLVFGIIIFLIPTMLFLIKYPKFTKNFFKVSIFFFYIHMILELVGLRLGYWVFPGTHYIGMISILGLSFPLEEFIFVICLGGFAACTYYEFFTNKKLK